MFVILVYDTLAERNPVVLKTCRQYLHWVQRSVFQGELSAGQYRLLTTTLRAQIETKLRQRAHLPGPLATPDRDSYHRSRQDSYGPGHLVWSSGPDLPRCITGGLPQNKPATRPPSCP
jgi:CRISPR associated protein Cas2